MPVTETQDRVAQAKDLVARQAVDGRERRRVPVDKIEIRAKDDGSYTFEGHAAVFDEMSDDLGGGFGSFREMLKRGAFKGVLKDDVRLLFNHNPDLVLARTTSGTLKLTEDPRGLKVIADVAPTSYASDLRVLLERGDVSQMSFAFRIGEAGADEWHEDEDGNVTRTILRVGEMFDVSAVTYPAYPQTDAAARGLHKLERGEVVTHEERGAIEALLEANSTEHPISEREDRADGPEPIQEAETGDRADVDEAPPLDRFSPVAARTRVYALLERAL
jgi:HK97 family phage prohead protease